MGRNKKEKEENQIKKAKALSHFSVTLNTFQNTIKHFIMKMAYFVFYSQLEMLTKNNKINKIK